MDFTPEQLLFLANSAEFEKVVASDPVLDEIEASRIDYALERLLLFDNQTLLLTRWVTLSY